MFTFKIKDTTPDMDLLLSRCLLVLAAIGALVIRTNQIFLINSIISILLLILATGANYFVKKMNWNRRLPLLIGAFILLIATHSIPLSAILLLIESINKKLYRQPIINISSAGVEIKKMLSNNLHPWIEFNNIILKDDLLTLDFKDNKLWQLNIIEEGEGVGEVNFNKFCSNLIQL